MKFSVRGSHDVPAWDTWSQRNIELLDDAEAVQLATAAFPVYLTPETVLDGATIRRDGTEETVQAVEFGPTGVTVDVLDMAIDSCGLHVLLTPSGEVYQYDPAKHELHQLACLYRGDGEPCAIAVSDDTLYLAVRDPGGVYAYSRSLGQTRWIDEANAPDPVTFVQAGQQRYLLDRGETPGAGVLRPVERDGVGSPVVTGLVAPLDAAVDTAGSVYILEPQLDGDPGTDRFLIRRIDRRALDWGPIPAAETVWIPPGAFRIAETGSPFKPGCLAVGAPGEVLVGTATDSASERWLHGYSPTKAAFDYHARFPTGCRELLLTNREDDSTIFVVDGEYQLASIDGSTAIRRDRSTDAHNGYLRTTLDAGVDETQWHRLELAIRDLGETEVRVHYRATDTEPPDRERDPDRGSIRDINGIGPRTAWRLETLGIADLVSLVAVGAETLATLLSVEEIRMREEHVHESLADAKELLETGDPSALTLEDIRHIGPIRAARLTQAGVTSVAAYAALDTDAITSLLTRELRTISTGQTQGWIEQAETWLAEHFDEPTFAISDGWTTVSVSSPADILLDQAVGRYLWIQLELIGTPLSTPIISAVDASYPRQSYLDDLPAPYREDQQTSEFLTEYLALFERVFTDVDIAMDAFTSYLDPWGFPADEASLQWLGDFLATEMDESWPTAAKREFIDRAPALYRLRGTRRGLVAMIDLYLDHAAIGTESWLGSNPENTAMQLARVIEHQELDCIDEPAWLDTYKRLISCPQGFLVLLHPALSEEHVTAIGRIVRHQRPAHTSGRAVALRPLTVLTVLTGSRGERGFHSYLGVNTTLTDRRFELDTSTLGQETVLDEHESDGSLGVQSRLDVDARLS